MTLKTRRFLFYGLFFIFILSGAGAILYSNGWRFNPASFHFKKTGAIYIETKPKDAFIKINNIYFKNRSGIIQKGTLVPNLLSKSYKIELKKDGYLPYFKNISVESAVVSELIDVILIPQEIRKESLGNSQKIKGDEFIALSKDGNKIILKESGSQMYYLYDLNNLSTAFNINVAFDNASGKEKTDIISIAFHPFESDKLIIETKKGLKILDTNRLILNTIINEQPIAWAIGNSNIYYETGTKSQIRQLADKPKSYTLYSYNLILKTKTALNQKPLAIEKGSEIKKIGVDNADNKIAFLDNFDDIYIFNPSNQELLQIAHSAKDFVFSPDNKKIAFLDNDGWVNIHFLEDLRQNINKKTGDVIRLNLENKSKIRKIIWHADSEHLFVDYDNRFDFIEIDDRLPLNQYAIVNQSLQFFYDRENNLIYFIQNNSLWKIAL
ncbi:MAG: hypothetical protein AAB516_00395 [Patescibacteria group bacterium]